LPRAGTTVSSITLLQVCGCVFADVSDFCHHRTSCISNLYNTSRGVGANHECASLIIPLGVVGANHECASLIIPLGVVGAKLKYSYVVAHIHLRCTLVWGCTNTGLCTALLDDSMLPDSVIAALGRPVLSTAACAFAATLPVAVYNALVFEQDFALEMLLGYIMLVTSSVRWQISWSGCCSPPVLLEYIMFLGLKSSACVLSNVSMPPLGCPRSYRLFPSIPFKHWRLCVTYCSAARANLEPCHCTDDVTKH
jgi:hypothetical protein